MANVAPEWQKTRAKIWAITMRQVAENIINGDRLDEYFDDDGEWQPGPTRERLIAQLFVGVDAEDIPRDAKGRIAVGAAAMDRLIGSNQLWRKYEAGAVANIGIDKVEPWIPGARSLWEVGPDGLPLWAMLSWDASATGLWLPIVKTAITERRWVAVVRAIKDKEVVNEAPVKLKVGSWTATADASERSVDVPDLPYADVLRLAEGLSGWTSDGWKKLAYLSSDLSIVPKGLREFYEDTIGKAEVELLATEEHLGVSGRSIDLYQPRGLHEPPMRFDYFTADQLTIIGALTAITSEDRGELYQWNTFRSYDVLLDLLTHHVMPQLIRYGLSNGMQVFEAIEEWFLGVVSWYGKKTGQQDQAKLIVESYGRQLVDFKG